ncbi:hypothetical protein [Candidatus Berkiella aquae]|uniref:Uncharacterized protein n=1 Tax=Candidatus Berkiella aquae TaxID=295108 RepID=A0A0Q9Z1V4_9GAMM|nr:hypothetical protein [Candidatus Berkiella aquae]MCS5712168.1 hypothetical protein [Candidatus Berkiella aquae]
MKSISAGLLLLLSLNVLANDLQNDPQNDLQNYLPSDETQNNAKEDLSQDCIKSIGRLYRFYFHEIYPNPKNAACKELSATLGPNEAAQMQMIVTEFKSQCPAELVTKINGSFRELQKERDSAA